MDRKDHYFSSVEDVIGNTPLVELSRLVKFLGLKGRVLAKLDYLNPGFSKKDRVAQHIIREAKSAGELKPAQTVVELTSGNTGTGLAIVCGIEGHPFVAVMSKGNSEERSRMMSALGAEVVLVDQLPDSKPGQVSGGDLALVEKKTREIVKERKAFRADQFKHEGNFLAHYRHTGPEFLEQSGGGIDGFCDFVGSGGTFAGCAAAFKEHNSDIQCYVIEPETAPAILGKAITNANHVIQGGGYSIKELSYLNKRNIDGYLSVSDSEAIEMTRLLARTEGIFAGFSSGANLAGAVQLLKGALRGGTLAIVICDSGLKYLSTNLWGG